MYTTPQNYAWSMVSKQASPVGSHATSVKFANKHKQCWAELMVSTYYNSDHALASPLKLYTRGLKGKKAGQQWTRRKKMVIGCVLCCRSRLLGRLVIVLIWSLAFLSLSSRLPASPFCLLCLIPQCAFFLNHLQHCPGDTCSLHSNAKGGETEREKERERQRQTEANNTEGKRDV